MTSARKIAANRRNATRSTGARTAAGKLHAKRNALRHGLATCISNDAVVAPEIERLMRHLALNVDDPNRRRLAKEIAEAEFEILRVRRVRTGLVDRTAVDAGAGVPSSNPSKLALVEQAIENTQLPFPAAKDRLPSVAAAVQRVAAQLVKLDRYERRALSRRKRAVREFYVQDVASGGDRRLPGRTLNEASSRSVGADEPPSPSTDLRAGAIQNVTTKGRADTSQEKSVSGNDSEIQSIAGTEPVAGGPIPAKDFSWIDALIGEDLYDGLSTREFLDLCELELFKGEANWSREDRRRHREIWAKIFATNEILRGLPSLLEWPEDDAE